MRVAFLNITTTRNAVEDNDRSATEGEREVLKKKKETKKYSTKGSDRKKKFPRTRYIAFFCRSRLS